MYISTWQKYTNLKKIPLTHIVGTPPPPTCNILWFASTLYITTFYSSDLAEIAISVV